MRLIFEELQVVAKNVRPKLAQLVYEFEHKYGPRAHDAIAGIAVSPGDYLILEYGLDERMQNFFQTGKWKPGEILKKAKIEFMGFPIVIATTIEPMILTTGDFAIQMVEEQRKLVANDCDA